MYRHFVDMHEAPTKKEQSEKKKKKKLWSENNSNWMDCVFLIGIKKQGNGVK